MYPPPSSTVIEQLERHAVLSVSFGKYTIHLQFENGNRLSFSAQFRFGHSTKLAESTVNEFPLEQTDLIRALGSTVDNVISEDDGTLNLFFSNGDALVIYANDPMYEAYTLLVDGKEYVV
jgi:hypothetical protein